MFDEYTITQKLCKAVESADSGFSLAVGGNYYLCAKHYLVSDTASLGTVVSSKN
jgi:hypothetical protein